MIALEEVYFSSIDESLMSKWQCTLHLQFEEDIREEMIIVPSITPGVEIIFDVHGINSFGMNRLYESFKQGSKYWDNLNYNAAFSHKNNRISCILQCRQFCNMKTDLLLYNPLSSGVNGSIIVDNFTSVNIQATFKGRKMMEEVINHFNVYVDSLFLSQLEFQLPLVFSAGIRRRMTRQEPTIGCVSNCLGNSQNITPSIVKTISLDKTSSMAFQALHETCNLSTFKLKIEKGEVAQTLKMFQVKHP